MPPLPPSGLPLLLASQPQQVLAPLLLLLFALGSASSSARAMSSAESSGSSRLDGVTIRDSPGTQRDGLQPFIATAAAAATAAHTHLTATSPNRVPFLLDPPSFRQLYASPAKASNTSETAIQTISAYDIDENQRYKREDKNEDPCIKFSEGDKVRHEFYSPGYPNQYPKNISCYRVLKAEEGHVLRVEFRDKFDLEEEDNCKYDFLEVRDGGYGYSRPYGNYCRAFPFPEITSSGSSLWLRFHSDQYIEGTGFRAVYNEIPRPNMKTKESTKCWTNVTHDSELIIDTADIEAEKQQAIRDGTELDCIWNITVKEGHKIQISFIMFALEKPNECDINYVQIYNRKANMEHNPELFGNFCGSIADLESSSGNVAFLRFFATKAAMNSSFKALITVTREKTKGKECNNETEFDCQDVCIDRGLICNDRHNCRYRFDEDDEICKSEASSLNLGSQHVIIILVVFSLLLFGLCFSCIYNCTTKLIRDHKIIKEHIRQSREKSLDELGRKSASLLEACTEIGGGGGSGGGGDGDADDNGEGGVASTAHIHRSQRHQRRQHSSESVNSGAKEVASPVTMLGWQRSMQHSVDLSDIHQSNNARNASHERQLRESGERETRDMECQTRESIFETSVILKPTGFTTFGYPTPVGSRKQSVEYHPGHHYHHHAHPHYHPQPYVPQQHQQHQHHHHHHYAHRQVADGSSPEHQTGSPGPARRCSVCHPGMVATVEPPILCPRHSNTPIVPAPHGWSAHESLYSAEELETLSKLLPVPEHSQPLTQLHQRGSLVRQRTVGSGENYGFLYGPEHSPSSADGSTAAGSSPAPTSSAASSTSAAAAAAAAAKCPQLLSDSRFKTEAVIEVDQKRPFSIESTKSAPDVIATH